MQVRLPTSYRLHGFNIPWDTGIHSCKGGGDIMQGQEVEWVDVDAGGGKRSKETQYVRCIRAVIGSSQLLL